jgi:hypothetical protein
MAVPMKPSMAGRAPCVLGIKVGGKELHAASMDDPQSESKPDQAAPAPAARNSALPLRTKSLGKKIALGFVLQILQSLRSRTPPNSGLHDAAPTHLRAHAWLSVRTTIRSVTAFRAPLTSSMPSAICK